MTTLDRARADHHADEGDAGFLPDALLRKLARVRLSSPRALPRESAGRHAARRGPGAGDVVDRRPFVDGDDVRHIDWHLWARLDRPMIKLRQDQGLVALDLIVDASASMSFGHPSKLTAALRLAGALSYVALQGHYQVSLTMVNDRARAVLGPLDRPRDFARVKTFARNARPEGATNLARALATMRAGRSRPMRPTLAVLISDFHDPAGVEPALVALTASRWRALAVPLLAPEETRPKEYNGPVILRDAESGAEHTIMMSPEARAAYQARLARRRHAFDRTCRARGIACVSASSSDDIDALVFRVLRQGRFLA